MNRLWRDGDFLRYKRKIYLIKFDECLDFVFLLHPDNDEILLRWMSCFLEDDDVYYVSPEEVFRIRLEQ